MVKMKIHFAVTGFKLNYIYVLNYVGGIDYL